MKVNKVHGLVATLLITSIVTAIVTYFLPQHAVRERIYGPGCSIGFNMCDGVDDDRRCVVTPGPLGPGHAGADHNGVLPVLFLGLLLAVVVATLVTPGAKVVPFLAIPAVIALLASLFHLDHLFEDVETLPAGALHGLALLVTVAMVIGLCVVHPIAYRRRAVAPPPLARVV